MRSAAENAGAAASIAALHLDFICCSKKKLEPRRVNDTVLYRCMYCGIYSCDNEHCLYKNKHWKCMKKHATSHKHTNEIYEEFQMKATSFRDNDAAAQYRSKSPQHKYTQTESETRNHKHIQTEPETSPHT